MDGEVLDDDPDLLEEAELTSGSVHIDEPEHAADLADTSLSALSGDGRSITGTSAELDELGAAGIAALEARLRLSPRVCAALPVFAQVPPPAPAAAIPAPELQRPPPELEGSVRALAEQQRLQAQELAELRRSALSRSAAGQPQAGAGFKSCLVLSALIPLM